MTYEEMFDLIIETAEEDDRIRAVTMEGSKVNPGSVHDKYSDFDMTFYVTDIREFTSDKDYMKRFGEILIMQMPEDFYNHPYDYKSREPFTYLTQYKDGNRIDLTFIDISDIEVINLFFKEPRKVLINKDSFKELSDIETDVFFYISKPGEFEFFNTVNEFRWVSNYATKGLCRDEFFYARHAMEFLMMNMFIKMLNWKIGIDNDFKVSTGSSSKYLKKYLTAEEMQRFKDIFAGSDYNDMWDKLFLMYDYFTELSTYVAEKLFYPIDNEEAKNVRDFMLQRRADFDNNKSF